MVVSGISFQCGLPYTTCGLCNMLCVTDKCSPHTITEIKKKLINDTKKVIILGCLELK